MRLNNGLGDRQAKTAVAGGSAARFVGAVEALENVRQVFGRNAGAACC